MVETPGDFVHNGDFETGHLGAWQCTGSDCNVVQGQDGGLVAIKLELFSPLLQAPPGGGRSAHRVFWTLAAASPIAGFRTTPAFA